MRVRLKDIAKIVDLSVASVSLILNDPQTKRISEKKKEEVLKIAEELNYIPNTSARNLALNKSNTLGLLIPDLENPFFSSLAKSVETICRELNYTLLISSTNENYQNDPLIIIRLVERNVEGLIIALSANSYNNEKLIIAELKKLRIPYILIDRSLRNYDDSQIIFNNKQGQYLATKYVIDNNHKDIAYITARNNALSGHFRHEGFLKAMSEADIPVRDELIADGDFSFNNGYNNFEKIYKHKPTAIVCANDLIAFGVLKRANELGLKIPRDISIVGYDNLKLNDMLNIGLTTIAQDEIKLAQEAMNLLQKMIKGDKETVRLILEPKLVKRKSVKRI